MKGPDVDVIEREYRATNPPYSTGHLLAYIPVLLTRVRELEARLAQKVCRHEWLRREGEEVRCQHCRALMVKSDMGPYVAASEIAGG